MIVTLIGYRGTGKSTVGGALAARLGWECVDSDPLIEQRAGKPIARIFAEDGEPRFRHLEQAVLADLLNQRSEIVLATGGGAVLNPNTRQAMRQAGPVVWLQASVETIQSRLATDATTAGRRPPLVGDDARAEVAAVLAEREPVYAEAATIVIDTEERSIAGIVDEIIRQLPLEKGPVR